VVAIIASMIGILVETNARIAQSDEG